MQLPLDPEDQHTVDDISKFGWSGIIIPPDSHGPGFEYTVGLLAEQQHPEIIIFGLKQSTAHDVLWQVYNEIRAGKTFRETGLYANILVDCNCRMQIVHPTWHREFFGYALWHRWYARINHDFCAMQCVWPDKQGLFPDDSGCDAFVAKSQPDLSKPKSSE